MIFTRSPVLILVKSFAAAGFDVEPEKGPQRLFLQDVARGKPSGPESQGKQETEVDICQTHMS